MTQETKQILLQSGYDIFIEKGYNGTGINDILKRAGVPKGSFYHHFSSKEDFLIQVLEYYLKSSAERMMPFIQDRSIPSLKRFTAYIESKLSEFEGNSYQGGCFIGNIGQEMSGTSDGVRDQVRFCMNAWHSAVEAFLIQAQEEKTICPNHNTKELADVFVDGWQGALLRMKIERSIEPLTRFLNAYLKILRMRGDNT